MLAPGPSLGFSVGVREWEVPRGGGHQAGPNLPPFFPQEAPKPPEGTLFCSEDRVLPACGSPC
jgi:hypothetical protein